VFNKEFTYLLTYLLTYYNSHTSDVTTGNDPDKLKLKVIVS